MMKTHLRPPFAALASIHAIVLAIMTAFLSGPTYAKETKAAPIHTAAEAGNVAELKRILDKNADAWKIKDKLGKQPLHLAASEGRNEALTLLLDKGADVAALGYMGWTALHYAARGGHPETCRILLKRGADREAVCKLKRTALQGADSPETRHVLLSFKVLIPGIKDFIFAASTGDLKKAQELLEKTPGLLNATGPAGRTAAMEAAAHNRVEVLQWLIESAADINFLTKDREESALYLATSGGHVEAFRLLLKHKAEVNPPPTDESDLTATPSPLSEATNVFRYSERGARMAAAMSKGGSEGELKKHLLAEANEGELFGELLKGMFQQMVLRGI